jgi:histidine ammonia-lyase
MAMDSLKTAIASVADMADRQVQNMVNPNINRGLPADLVRRDLDDNLTHHGFKAMSISASALTAEALKNTMPATSFSRSTESHNQDKVSMGTIAARDAERICTLTERVCAIDLMCSAQASEITGNYSDRPEIIRVIDQVRKYAKATIEDRPMDFEIEALRLAIKDASLFNK